MFLKACNAIEATTTTQHADDKGFFSFQKAKKPWSSSDSVVRSKILKRKKDEETKKKQQEGVVVYHPPGTMVLRSSKTPKKLVSTTTHTKFAEPSSASKSNMKWMETTGGLYNRSNLIELKRRRQDGPRPVHASRGRARVRCRR